MYSLLVYGLASDFADGELTIERGRFLEWTGENISVQLESLTRDAIEAIQSWPCLLMQEGRGQEPAFLVRIRKITPNQSAVRVEFERLVVTPPLLNDTIWKLRTKLGIEQFEFNRNHWAVKEHDALEVLAASGITVEDGAASRFVLKPLPLPTRDELIVAGRVLSSWSHTQIDDFLRGVGLNIPASREVGGRQARMKAIVDFALENPTASTLENFLLASRLIREASQLQIEKDSSDRAAAGSTPIATIHEAKRSKRASPPGSRRVFVVHGRDEATRTKIVEVLTSLGLQAIVLHEQPNMGRHLLTKFIDEADLVGFAVVIMTDDDAGKEKSSKELQPRARQNVVFELGYLIAHLGQERVCALVTPGLETPSDFDGIVYVKIDTDNRWKAELRRELVAAGMPVVAESDCAEPRRHGSSGAG
jgi:predicted nucleotide-binding protein